MADLTTDAGLTLEEMRSRWEGTRDVCFEGYPLNQKNTFLSVIDNRDYDESYDCLRYIGFETGWAVIIDRLDVGPEGAFSWLQNHTTL